MENPTNTPGTAQPKPLAPEVAAACEIAATDGEPGGDPMLIRGAYKRAGEHWYRVVWRYGGWKSCAHGDLASNTSCYVMYGRVWPGELIAQHDHGGPVTSVWLVTDTNPLEPCTFTRRGDGTLCITLPDGREVKRPDPLP